MTYAVEPNNKFVTTFKLTASGELITHVTSGNYGGRHDVQVGPGTRSFTYSVPPSALSVADIGAVLYGSGSAEYSCNIGPAGAASGG